MAGGRPTDYTPEIAQRICDATATTTESYTKICETNRDFPAREIMRLWRYRHSQFKAMYEVAKQEQAELYVEELRERARDRSEDLISSAQGDKPNPAAIARDKLIIDTDKWIACKLLPKVYGEKQQVETTVKLHEDTLRELE